MPRKGRVNGVLRESSDEELEHGSNNSANTLVNDSDIAGYAPGLLDRFIAGSRVARRMPEECKKVSKSAKPSRIDDRGAGKG